MHIITALMQRAVSEKSDRLGVTHDVQVLYMYIHVHVSLGPRPSPLCDLLRVFNCAGEGNIENREGLG